MNVLQIGSDRSKRGIHVSGSAAYTRQKAYADAFGELTIIGFTRASDGYHDLHDGSLHIYPTTSRSRWSYVYDAVRMGRSLPKPDVISAQDPFEAGIAAWFIAHHFGIPLHVQVHTDFLSPAYSRHSLVNRMRVHIARFILRRASGIRVVSQRIADSLATNNFQLTTIPTILPIYTDTERLKKASVPSDLGQRFGGFKYKLLVVSRLEPEKNPCLAIRAFAKAAAPDACLIIVGGGSERGHLEELAREFDISNRVFFEGEKDAAPYYALADLVLVTSRYEGYGLVIVEALAAGKPVLSTDVGIAHEAGAMVAEEGKYADALSSWFASGSRTVVLHMDTYRSFEEYVQKYCTDIKSLK